YYAMDRDNRWERVGKAYSAMVLGEGTAQPTAAAAMQASYAAGITDEFVVPSVIDGGAHINADDAVVFFNFRPDRAREITRTLIDPDFSGFARKFGALPLTFVCMTQYDVTMPNVKVAFLPQSLSNTFGAYIAEKGLQQLRIAETEKYAHVTFFFNGGVETPYANEDRALIASPKVATYDLQPEMSAPFVCEEMLKRIRSDKYDVIILNFANCDMVGHTGVFDAAVKAVEAVDDCVGKIAALLHEKSGVLLLTADHGNADQMYDEDVSHPFTAHTTNPVPFLVCGLGNVCLREGGRLADIAPTMLKILGLQQPVEMTGESIVL
ncbi:MAG: 2,3-bisphosphoglycerate-independent phosphoglycerate mutase, partial [Pygmaiobacter sp.]